MQPMSQTLYLLIKIAKTRRQAKVAFLVILLTTHTFSHVPNHTREGHAHHVEVAPSILSSAAGDATDTSDTSDMNDQYDLLVI